MRCFIYSSEESVSTLRACLWKWYLLSEADVPVRPRLNFNLSAKRVHADRSFRRSQWLLCLETKAVSEGAFDGTRRWHSDGIVTHSDGERKDSDGIATVEWLHHHCNITVLSLHAHCDITVPESALSLYHPTTAVMIERCRRGSYLHILMWALPPWLPPYHHQIAVHGNDNVTV